MCILLQAASKHIDILQERNSRIAVSSSYKLQFLPTPTTEDARYQSQYEANPSNYHEIDMTTLKFYRLWFNRLQIFH
ncbi:hypothetical protein QVD17_19437 [Tagetes erecta]|uniref:Uncharacterized protein n=1 Tax=Tagetes erecta TaxID=13708 RepID=A0AAD8KPQ7_TARER|nr:hypothetical protein QVD17_19437 [Tagetes erecta]